jgi:molybdopterin adenylyltransferase
VMTGAILIIGDKVVDLDVIMKASESNGMKITLVDRIGKSVNEIAEKLYNLTCKNYDAVFTIGGTGIEDDDLTPEATERVIDKRLPGIEYFIFRETVNSALTGMFARIIAGIRRKTFVINLPGYGYERVFPKIVEAVKLIREGVKLD